MNILKRYWLYFIISAFFIVPGIVSLASNGVRPAIDFTGGSLIEVNLGTDSLPTTEELQTSVQQIYQLSSVQNTGAQSIILKGKTISNDQKNLVIDALKASYPAVQELRFETVGPTLGRELLIKMITAMVIVAVLITVYVWRQFDELKFGVSAVLAMIHDSLVLLGAFSVLGAWKGIEVDVLFVTALLTTLSFSVHDTIVVFDRIRELRRKHGRYSFKEIANAAVLETMGRSLNNSMTIIFMLLSLFLLGGESIRWFAAALLIGAVTGTYSSTFTAVPLLLAWDDLRVYLRKK